MSDDASRARDSGSQPSGGNPDMRDEYILQLEAEIRGYKTVIEQMKAVEAKKACSFKTFMFCRPPTYMGSVSPSMTM